MKAAAKNVARLGRWQLRRAQMTLRYGNPVRPVLFANSFPKSGTHLLTQILDGFSQLGPFAITGLPAVTMYDGPTGDPRPMNEIVRALKRMRPGDIGYGHLHAEPEIVAALCRPGVAPYFVLRDPRDVVVSHVFYVTEIEPNHAHHRYYVEELPDFDARLKVSILGRPEFENPFPDIAERLAPYLGWLERSEVLTVRFEEFMQDRTAALGRVFDHAVTHGFEYKGSKAQAVQTLSDQIAPERSPTFRKGKVGGWQAHFTPAHKDLFKQVTGDMLVRLGYAQDMDW